MIYLLRIFLIERKNHHTSHATFDASLALDREFRLILRADVSSTIMC